MAALKNKLIEVQDRAIADFDAGKSILAGLEFKNTMFEATYVEAFKQRELEFEVYMDNLATEYYAMANYENGGAWD